MTNSIKISIVIPCYNEEEVLAEVHKRILEIFAPQPYAFEIIFVDDGSKDKTLEMLQTLHAENSHIHYLSFARNFGHQAALKAGLDHAQGDAVISMDADLQHPPDLIPVFIEKWKEGYHIVYTQREKSPSNSYFKNFSSSFFYKLMNWLSDVEFEEGTADFRLLDKQVVSLIRQSSETNLFLRGYINWLGFKRFKIVYKPNERFAGTTKYSLKKMVNLAISGITAFSIKPLQMAVYLGLTISLFAFLYALYAFYMYFFGQKVISGWTSVILSILFVGGAQLTILGIIGQYLGYALMQVKKRPDYIIQEKTID